ncbi:MAG: leucyl aminopeptidase family protein, partial [Steroidobacteraceae bacterium]
MSQEMLLSTDPADSRPLWVVTEEELPGWLAGQPSAVVGWVRAHGFQAERHRVLSLPSAEGGIGGAVAGLGSLASVRDLTLWHAAGLSDRLPAQSWQVATPLTPPAATRFLLGWLMGAYRMDRYRLEGAEPARAVLVPPRGADLEYADAAARATTLARDLINTPANDLGPEELAEA